MRIKRLAWALALCLALCALPARAEWVASGEAEAAWALAEGDTGAAGLTAWSDDLAAETDEEVEETSSAEMPDEADALPAVALTLGVGETFRLSDYMDAAEGCAVSDDAIVSIGEDGMVTALSVGEAEIVGAAARLCLTVKHAPEQLLFSASAFSLGKGETTDALTLSLFSEQGDCAGGYTLTSSNKKIVAVNADGSLKGVKAGKATLTATAYNGVQATCKVTVAAAPSKLTLSASAKTLGLGESGAVTAKLPAGSASQVRYTSDHPEIVAVDARTGALTAVGLGAAHIQGSTFNGKKASIEIQVLPAPQAVRFDADALTLGAGQKAQLSASPDEGSAGQIAYESTDTAVVTVTASGAAVAVAPGAAEIVATAYNGVAARCSVRVLHAPTAVSLPFATLTLGVGEKVQLTPDVGDSASSYTWSVKSSRIATVSKDGVVKGVRKGTTTLTVKTYNNLRCTLKIVVKKAPSQLTVTPATRVLGVGQRFQPSFKLSSSAAGSVSWSSSDEAVLRVDAATGEALALAPGVASVVARSYNGKQASCKVTVKPAPEAVEAEYGFIELGAGQSFQLNCALSPADSYAELRFESDDPGVAQVDPNGKITAVGRGQTTVGVFTHVPEVAAWVSVTVWDAPEWVSLGAESATLNVGETLQLSPALPEGSMSAFTYSTADAALATVDENGAVVALKRGSVKLTVATYNGKKATLTLNILDPWYPEALTLGDVPDCLRPGERFQVQYAVSPENAIPQLTWSSSSPKVASVDAQGLITAASSGMTTIVATSEKNPALVLRFNILVQAEGVVPALPARTTTVAGIAANLAKIEALRNIAVGQVDLLQSQGVISSSEAAKRRTIVNNAFKDYAFPWMTPALQKYWKAANSEGGAKDFKPGVVYYGMPYMSGSGKNRQYNAVKAVAERRYTDSGSGYYLLNRDNLLSGRYVGNDCSCFVNLAIWGASSAHAADRTGDIAKSSAYKTIADTSALRPGDLLCKSNTHVVMFLFYTNAERTQVMVIENGGPEPAVNTVHCSVYDLSYYTKKGYKARRLAGLK